MTAHDFAYWLQGFAELNAEPPTPEQWAAIREHLGLVFQKVTPPFRQPINPLTPGYSPDWSKLQGIGPARCVTRSTC